MRVLDELGLRLLFPGDNDPRFAKWMSMARELYRDSDTTVVGLVPVERDVGVISAALQLGVALNHLTGRAVTLVDCNTVLPAWKMKPGARLSKEPSSDEVCGGVFVVSRSKPTLSVDLHWCTDMVTSASERGHFVFCDLTGLPETGTLGDFFPLLQGLVSVVRSGATFEWRLTSLHQQFPRQLDRGVLFLDR